MARTITDEQIKLSIIINGNPAQKQLLDLEKATRKLTEEKKGLQIELRRVETALGKDSAEYKKLALQIKNTTTEIDNNKATMKALQDQIGITGLTIGQLTQKANLLKISLRNVIPGSEDYNRYEAELKQVSARLGELSGKAQQAKFSISNIADGFNKYAALGASVIATLTGVVFSVQKMIDLNGKLSEAQVDVMKTTRMTKEEVDELGKSFGLLETRTSRIDLYKIAEQGGRLGVPKAEIADFVKSMNVAAVSLGDSFTGGVEEVAEKLGKIKFLFKETKELNIEDAYNSIGSAINDLGADGVASEANIAEFTKRMGSLTDVLKPTVQETLALGAAFEESGIEAETSSRAYNIFMKQASTESGKFAQVMGISKKAVEDMINTNPLDFMLNFAQGLNGMNATEVAKTLDFLGVNADGANKVIGAMGNNFTRFHELIDLSNQSFADGSSLADEYKVKNENLAATLEKISKKVSGWFSSEGFINFLGKAVNWFAIFIGATNDADGAISKWKNTLVNLIKIIAVTIVGFTSYRLAIQLIAIMTNGLSSATTLLTIAQKANALSGGTLKALYLILQYAFFTMTMQTDKATASMLRFNLATKMNPIGLVVGLIMAAVAAYIIFNKEVDKSIAKQKNLNDVRAKAQSDVIEEKNN
jgi:TP901 family phage tail tape measure protein